MRNTTPTLPLEQRRNSCPLSARLARASCPRRTLANSPEPISQRPVSLRRGPEHEPSYSEVALSLLCALSTMHVSRQRSGSPSALRLSGICTVSLTAGAHDFAGAWVPCGAGPFSPIACQMLPLPPAGPAGRFCRGLWDPKRRAGSVGRRGCSGARARCQHSCLRPPSLSWAAKRNRRAVPGCGKFHSLVLLLSKSARHLADRRRHYLDGPCRTPKRCKGP
jgi:hypothetical protein